MNQAEKIDQIYHEAAKGLNDVMLDDPDLWYSYVVNLPEKLQTVYTIGILNQQVMNGGFHQYFFNRYGMFSELTIDHLNTIGATQTAKLLQEALTSVNYEGSDADELRRKIYNKQIDKIEDFDDDLCAKLSDLDEKYETADGGNFEVLLSKYFKIG